jgi:hypothetical protein
MIESILQFFAGISLAKGSSRYEEDADIIKLETLHTNWGLEL